jgi:hypothetical protein
LSAIDGAKVLARRLSLEPKLVFVNPGTMERTFAATLLPARVASMPRRPRSSGSF